jgi:hypothetical protein
VDYLLSGRTVPLSRARDGACCGVGEGSPKEEQSQAGVVLRVSRPAIRRSHARASAAHPQVQTPMQIRPVMGGRIRRWMVEDSLFIFFISSHRGWFSRRAWMLRYASGAVAALPQPRAALGDCMHMLCDSQPHPRPSCCSRLSGWHWPIGGGSCSAGSSANRLTFWPGFVQRFLRTC